MEKQQTEDVYKSGDVPCDHPSLEQEFAYDMPTGDYYCTQCNRLLSSIIGANVAICD